MGHLLYLFLPWGLSCPIVNPEIDFLPGSLVRFIYKVAPAPCAWSSSELFGWQNGPLASLPCLLAPVLRKGPEFQTDKSKFPTHLFEGTLHL